MVDASGVVSLLTTTEAWVGAPEEVKLVVVVVVVVVWVDST